MNIGKAKAARPLGKLVPNPKARLREQFHEVARFRYLSGRTETTYWQWVVRYLKFHRQNGQWRHPRELAAKDIAAFLSDLSLHQKVAASTQAQALNALIFLYREVLLVLVEEIGEFERVRRPARLPVVLSREEVKRVLAAAAPQYQLPLRLLYGTGVRLMECLRLRVKDLDFDRNQIVVRSGKGGKDRITMLPESLKAELGAHLERLRLVHARELECGRGECSLPEDVIRKHPGAAREWVWQFVFPADRGHARSNVCHHLHEDVLQRGMKTAMTRASLGKRATCHTLRHSLPRTCWNLARTSGRCRCC